MGEVTNLPITIHVSKGRRRLQSWEKEKGPFGSIMGFTSLLSKYGFSLEMAKLFEMTTNLKLEVS